MRKRRHLQTLTDIGSIKIIIAANFFAMTTKMFMSICKKKCNSCRKIIFTRFFFLVLLVEWSFLTRIFFLFLFLYERAIRTRVLIPHLIGRQWTCPITSHVFTLDLKHLYGKRDAWPVDSIISTLFNMTNT